MDRRRLIPFALTATLMFLASCEINAVTNVTTPSTKPKVNKTATPDPDEDATPTPDPDAATPTPAATATASATPKPGATPTATPTPTPGPPATGDEITAATAFPFTEPGLRWTYKLNIKIASFNLPGTLVIECQTAEADGADVRSTFNIDMSKFPLAASTAPKTIDKVQRLKKTGRNPYAEIVNSLFEDGGPATGTPNPTATATPTPAPVASPESTKETIQIGDKSYATVRQKFKSNLAGSDVEFDLYMTAADGMVKQLVKGKKLPGALVPASYAAYAAFPFDMTTDLEKREKGTPSTPLPASPTPTPSATPTASPTPSPTPTATPTPLQTGDPNALPTETPTLAPYRVR